MKRAILEHGYRHIDTAFFYHNEDAIGVALKEVMAAGVKREDLFITTKLWRDHKTNPEEGLRISLERLQLDYVDLYLIHWMTPFIDEEKKVAPTPVHRVWAGLEECVKKGLTKNIGVSNCGTQLLVDIMTYAEVWPANNQIELHPYNSQYGLVRFC